MIVRVADQNVVYAGDLLFNGIFPVTFDAQATVSGWRSTLKTFASWTRTRCLSRAMGTFADKKELRCCARPSMTSKNSDETVQSGSACGRGAASICCAGEIFETIHVYLGIFNRPDYPKDVQGMGREK